jgi:hypothetical protein
MLFFIVKFWKQENRNHILQLFPKKCEVELQKHSKPIAGRTETSKNGQNL